MRHATSACGMPALLLAIALGGALSAAEPATAPPTAAPDAVAAEIARLKAAGYPLVDLHTHLKGGLTLAEVEAATARDGIERGVAVNCGVGFPITDERGIDDFLKTLPHRPKYLGMQAEGREWTGMFSRQARAKFDYIFTDAMTLTDLHGRRTRLWIKSEVQIDDKQAFMDHLVKTTVGILDSEPIDIYVNPTYLPEVIAAEYDQLWTPARVKQVIDAAARNRVAIEINTTLKLPKADFIKQAKRAGVKFTFGTNNADKRLSRLEYCLAMIRECDLKPDDLWLPKPRAAAPAPDAGAEARARAWMPTAVAEGSGVFQYAIPAKSAKGAKVTAYLWLPAKAEKVRGLVMGGDLMMEANFIVDPVIRAACEEQAIGILFFMKGLYGNWDKGDEAAVMQVLKDLAAATNHPELADVALMPIGHSAASPPIGTILHAIPDRCFAALTYKGAQPIPNDKPTERVRGIPTLHVQDFAEEYKDRRETGSIGRLNVLEIRGKDTQCLSGIVEDNGAKHACWCFRLTPLLAEFIRAAAELRIGPDGKCRPVPVEAGALVDKNFVAPRHATAPAAEYKGEPKEALWYPSLKMAQMLSDYNAVQLGKRAQYIAFADPNTGAAVDAKAQPSLRFVGGDEFELAAVYLPKADNPALPQDPVTHADTSILFAPHGRKLVLVGRGRFRPNFHPTAVRWYRLSAYSMGDAEHRFEENLLTLSLPKPGPGAAPQTITFPEIGSISRGDLPLKLKATSSAGVPVRYTVEYGPVLIDAENRLVLAEVPVKAKGPLEIGVWAYSFGSYTEPKVQAAEPVKQIVTVKP